MQLNLPGSGPLFINPPKYRNYFTAVFVTAYLLSETILIFILHPWYLVFPCFLYARMERHISSKKDSIFLKQSSLCFWSDKNECAFECLQELNKCVILEWVSVWRSESAYNRPPTDTSATPLPPFNLLRAWCVSSCPFRSLKPKTRGIGWRKEYCYPTEVWSYWMPGTVAWKWLQGIGWKKVLRLHMAAPQDYHGSLTIPFTDFCKKLSINLLF